MLTNEPIKIPDKKFLKFFFERLKLNDKDAYKDEFPFMSPCGVEMNFIKCEELPTVYNKIITFDQAKNFKPLEKQLKVSEPHYNGYLLYAGDQLWTPFEPSKLSVNPESGRVYHPCEKHLGGVALIASALATELSSHFHYPQNNTTEDEVRKFVIPNFLFISCINFFFKGIFTAYFN